MGTASNTKPGVGVLSWVLVLFTISGRWCFVDECNSLHPKGLRTQTHNLTLAFTNIEPIVDPFRFSRNSSDNGFVQYVSEVGFESVTIVGYAYNSDVVDTDWQFEVRTGEAAGEHLRRVRVVNSSNLHVYTEPWKDRPVTKTSWKKFRITLTELPLCPKVIELWFRGNASGNAFPGWGLQVGRVRLKESLFPSCMIPSCLSNDPMQCFDHLSGSQPLQTIRDSTRNFSDVFVASDNVGIESSDAVAHFNGDGHRFAKETKDKGIITYSIPKGIKSIEITLFRCEQYRTDFVVVPYLDPQCKPHNHRPVLKDDLYFSNCWKRYKATIDFSDILECPPTYVDLVIEGKHANSLQISSVTLMGYGQTVQDPEFREKAAATLSVGIDKVDNSVTISQETPDGANSGQGSVKLEHWLPPTIVAGVVVLAIVAGIIIFRNGEVSDFIADYIEDNFPFIYKHFYAPDPPTHAQTPGGPPPSGRRPPPHSQPRNYSESMNFSCTFDKSLKTTREPPAKRDVTATREGFGEQLIDLSKHLQKAFWTSKVGKKQRVLEIEDQLGKGGFGKVWKARWQGTPVALKVVPLHATLRQEEKQARMAIMEAALSGCLAHPNIVSTYACEIREASDFDKDTDGMSVEDSQNKQRWTPIERFAQTNASKSFMKSQTKNDLEVRIIMEYCDRGSLVNAISNGWFRKPEDRTQPDLDAVILTALDIARGLYCLHENTIIHGDLKPHNVLLQNRPFVDTRGFIAKIADFGLSIKMESEQSHVDGMRMGTGGYVSPEVAVRGKILPASDIYSFGILLWELYMGELIQNAIKDAPKVSSRLTMGSWRPIFEEQCPKEYSRLACMCWNDFPDWRPTLEYIIDELNSMHKALYPPEDVAVEPQPPGVSDTTSAPTMTLP